MDFYNSLIKREGQGYLVFVRTLLSSCTCPSDWSHEDSFFIGTSLIGVPEYAMVDPRLKPVVLTCY